VRARAGVRGAGGRCRAAARRLQRGRCARQSLQAPARESIMRCMRQQMAANATRSATVA